MKRIYIDSDFKCHVTDDGAMTVVETEFFDNKCDALIECYRYVPEGCNWTREDGVIFYGVMITPWKDHSELEPVQRRYERERLADAENALAIMWGGATV